MHNDVWRSADGLVWEELTSDAPWAARSYHGVEAVGESLILFGGQGAVEFFNDVWRSDDGGKTWSKVLAHAPWAPRAGFKSMVVNDTILIFSGGDGNLHRTFYSDVWASSDKGATWEQRCAQTPWKGRAGAQVVSINSSLLLMGGDNDRPAWNADGPNFHDVWRSGDGGASWEPLGNASWSVRTGHQCATPDGTSIYCIGGAHQNGTTTLKHDVWKSTDSGVAWEKVGDNAWNCDPHDDLTKCGKDDFMLVVRDGEMWTIAGDEETSAPFPQDCEVWRLSGAPAPVPP